MGSLVVRASDFRPEDLGSMHDAIKYPPSSHGFHAYIVEVEIDGVAIYRPFVEFHRAKSYCHLYGAQGQRQTERNVHQGVLVHNPRDVALRTSPFLPYSSSTLSLGLNKILMFYRLALRYSFNHDDVIDIEPKRWPSCVLDVKNQQDHSSFSTNFQSSENHLCHSDILL
ncbi:hypothetical protein TNCV_1725311 [Trichonephila clavipes]|nr:hypothetical protein TNCV_1725311 [Trichonephila clavipes]